MSAPAEEVSWLNQHFGPPILREPLADDQCMICGGRLDAEHRCDACDLQYSWDRCCLCENERTGKQYGVWIADERSRGDATTLADHQADQKRTRIIYNAPYHRAAHVCNPCYLRSTHESHGCMTLMFILVAGLMACSGIFAAIDAVSKKTPRYGSALLLLLIFGGMAAGMYFLARYWMKTSRHNLRNYRMYGDYAVEQHLRKTGKSGSLYCGEARYEERGSFPWPQSDS